ncbi:MAG: phosphate/phosphite/phosphonate ABC transporter substrate-binding protein [Opitutales bacterium]
MRTDSAWRRCALRALLLVLAGLAVGCGGRDAPAADTGPDDAPFTLRIGYTPYETTIVDREAAYAAFANYLEPVLGIPVETVPVPEYLPTIDALASGRIHLTSLGSQAYLLARQRCDLRVIARRAAPTGRPFSYRSTLLARRGFGLDDLEAVRQRAADLTLLFTDRASTSGYLVPRAALSRMGLDPTEAFGGIRFTGGHIGSILSLVHGEADLAAVNNNRWEDLTTSGKVDPEQLNVLWTSASIPNGPVVIRSDVPGRITEAVTRELVTLPETAPAVWSAFAAQYPDPAFIYVRADHTAYAGLDALFQPDLPNQASLK